MLENTSFFVAVLFAIAALMVLGLVFWALQMSRARPHRLTPTEGHIKPHKSVLIFNMALCSLVLLGFGLTSIILLLSGYAFTAVEMVFFPTIGALLVWTFAAHFIPSLVGKRDIEWDETGLSGPAKTNTTKRNMLQWSELKRFKAGQHQACCRVKAMDGRTIAWDFTYAGYSALTDAVFHYRPDLAKPSSKRAFS